MLMPRRSARSGTPPERSSASRVLATAEQRAARLFHRRAASRICMIVDAAKDPRVSKTCINSGFEPAAKRGAAAKLVRYLRPVSGTVPIIQLYNSV